MISGRATPEGTAAYAARFPQFASSYHFRRLRLKAPLPVLQLSSLGLGTYLGEADEVGDAGYEAAVEAALAGGINLLDTAINYRHQRSERAIGHVLGRGVVPREQVVVCSKAGYIPFDGQPPADPRAYLIDTYLRRGIIQNPAQIAAGVHCMAPVFLADQLQRSLDNLGLETIDVFYLHNPETQQNELSREEFYKRLRTAFEFLEKAAAAGRIQFYGAATWNGLRVPPDSTEYLDLQRMVATAREVGGEQHRFRFVQLPYNLIQPEAYTLLNQTVDKPPYVSVLNAAYRLGLHVVASAALASGRLQGLGGEALEYLRGFLPGASSPTETAIQFVRSTSTVTTALVGMGRAEHVAANLPAVAVPPAAPAQVGRLLQS